LKEAAIMGSQNTLLDIAIMNGSDMVTGLVEETIKAVPEIAIGAARTIKGLNYRTLVRTVLPTVAFRAANAGASTSKGTYENRLFETYLLNPYWICDKAVALACEEGPAQFIAWEAQGIMESTWQYLGKQFYYGNTDTSWANANDKLGCPGLLQGYDTTNMEVDATGTTASTGSSAWLVRFGPRDITWVYGDNGQLALSPLREQTVLDGSSNPYTAFIQEILARPGIQFTRTYAACRIKNLTADSGKGLTDALISKALAKFPVGLPPDYLFCTRRSLQQLQASRTATTPTGSPAPIPTDSFGIPVLPTDSISNTETIV
jgi:hypothetical protein